jgi:hypothetical protein
LKNPEFSSKLFFYSKKIPYICNVIKNKNKMGKAIIGILGIAAVMIVMILTK